jgi:DNA-binding transcriptional LysR family regulator
MEFRTLEVFRAVATLRSFARAADALHMTQSAVSQRILNLEEQIGDRLFERSMKGTSLTQKGVVMLSYAERLLKLRADLIETLSEASTVRRMIRLGVSETVAQTWLPLFIGAVNEQYPLVTFEIDVDVTSEMRARLVAREADLCFLLGPVIEPGIDNLDLCSYPLCFAASPSMKFDHAPVTADQICRYPLITFPRSTPLYATIARIFQDRSALVPQIHCSSSVSTIIKMAIDKVGISILATALIEDDVRTGRLSIIHTDIDLPELNYCVSYRASPGLEIVATIAQIARTVASHYAAGHKLRR